jgi:hypothetical protein
MDMDQQVSALKTLNEDKRTEPACEEELLWKLIY